MEAEPQVYPVAGAVGPQDDEDRARIPDGPAAPVSPGGACGRAGSGPVGSGSGGRGAIGGRR